MKTRSKELELLDLGSDYYSKEEYEHCLHQLDRIGHYLGGNRATLKIIKKVSKPETVLEVGCGGGQFTLQLGNIFHEAQITGIDISREAIDIAQKSLSQTSLKNVSFNMCSNQLEYPSNSFDVITTTLVCHHMSDEQIVEFLKNAYRIARKSIIINDLHRHWLAYAGFFVIAKLFFPNRLIFNDGLLSIRRSFKRKDWIQYLTAAGIPLENCSITWHWAFRWIVHVYNEG